jgi:hypothetical protein
MQFEKIVAAERHHRRSGASGDGALQQTIGRPRPAIAKDSLFNDFVGPARMAAEAGRPIAATGTWFTPRARQPLLVRARSTSKAYGPRK